MDEINWEKMEHIECGGMVFLLESGDYWCMGCGEEIHILVED